MSRGAAIVKGLLAGGNLDRAIFARSAWREIGLVAWAQYSRHADLGNGHVFYPAMAFAGTILSLLAAILFLKSGRIPRQAALPIMLAAALMVVCLPISFKAAPFILSLRQITDQNVAALQSAFEGSFLWGRGQMILHTMAFLSNLWSVASLSRHYGQ
jgi:hypothetical protein